MGGPYTDNSLRFAAGILVYAGIIIATAMFIRRFSVKNEKSAPRLFCIVVLATTAVSEFCSLGLNVENNYLFITVINPVSGDILRNNPTLSTTKKDKSVHGIGLRVVKSIAEKYNGHTKFEQREGEFIASLMLEIPIKQ